MWLSQTSSVLWLSDVHNNACSHTIDINIYWSRAGTNIKHKSFYVPYLERQSLPSKHQQKILTTKAFNTHKIYFICSHVVEFPCAPHVFLKNFIYYPLLIFHPHTSSFHSFLLIYNSVLTRVLICHGQEEEGYVGRVCISNIAPFFTSYSSHSFLLQLIFTHLSVHLPWTRWEVL